MGSFTSFLVCQLLFVNAKSADIFHGLRFLFPQVQRLVISQAASPASKPASTVFGEAFLHGLTSHQTVYCLLHGVRRD